jgi:hypothetical protein
LKLKASTKGHFPSKFITGKMDSNKILKMEKRTPKGVQKQFPKSLIRHEQLQVKCENIPLREIQGYETKYILSLYQQAMGGWEGDNFLEEAPLSLPRRKDRRKKHF